VYDKDGNGTRACSFWIAARIGGETMMSQISWGDGDEEEAELWTDMCQIAEENAIVQPGRLLRRRGQNPGHLKSFNRGFSMDSTLEESLQSGRNPYSMQTSNTDYIYGHQRLRPNDLVQPSTSFLPIPIRNVRVQSSSILPHNARFSYSARCSHRGHARLRLNGANTMSSSTTKLN
jgi:hypothetical protein